MPEYIGVVADIYGDNSVEVEIRPGQAGIPGAPGVNVCHCPSEESRVSFRAENMAGASAGDMVRISREVAVVFKNVFLLIGMPLFGTALGLLAGIIMGWTWELSAFQYLPAAAVGLAAGAFLGISRYRRIGGHAGFVVTDILQKEKSMRSLENERSECLRTVSGACEICLGERSGTRH